LDFGKEWDKILECVAICWRCLDGFAEFGRIISDAFSLPSIESCPQRQGFSMNMFFEKNTGI
jgi:hypothetical protein